LEVGLQPCVSSSNLATGQKEKKKIARSLITALILRQNLCDCCVNLQGKNSKQPMSTTLTSCFIERKTSQFWIPAIGCEFCNVFG